MKNIKNNDDRRVIKHVDGLQNRFKLLDSLSKGEIKDAFITTACRTQKGLAQLNLPAHNITPMSLNTLKSAALKSNPSKWEDLDALRNKVWKSNRNPVKKFHGNDIETEPDAKKIIDEGYRIRAILYRAYLDLMDIADVHSHGNPILRMKLEEHRTRFCIVIGLRKINSGENHEPPAF